MKWGWLIKPALSFS